MEFSPFQSHVSPANPGEPPWHKSTNLPAVFHVVIRILDILDAAVSWAPCEHLLVATFCKHMWVHSMTNQRISKTMCLCEKKPAKPTNDHFTGSCFFLPHQVLVLLGRQEARSSMGNHQLIRVNPQLDVRYLQFQRGWWELQSIGWETCGQGKAVKFKDIWRLRQTKTAEKPRTTSILGPPGCHPQTLT